MLSGYPPDKKGAKMAIFYSTRRRLGLVIDPGGDISVEVGQGVFKNKRVEEIKARFDEHELDTEKFFKNNEKELLKRGWTVEAIDERIRNTAQFNLDYHEVKPPTPEEKLAAANALIAQANELRREAEKLRPQVEKKEMVIEAPVEKKGFTEERRERQFKCKECGFVAKTGTGLAVHLRKKHLEDLGETKTKL